MTWVQLVGWGVYAGFGGALVGRPVFELLWRDLHGMPLRGADVGALVVVPLVATVVWPVIGLAGLAYGWWEVHRDLRRR